MACNDCKKKGKVTYGTLSVEEIQPPKKKKKKVQRESTPRWRNNV